MDITAERLREILNYEPETGVFTWTVAKARRVKIGDVAGTFGSLGYVVIGIDGRDYTAHRLAFLYMTGKWPENDVDHSDRDRANNRWRNLREATRQQNSFNQSKAKNNTSGVPGVRWSRQTDKWMVSIRIDGKLRHLGSFDDKENAIAARTTAEIELFGEYAPRKHGEVALWI